MFVIILISAFPISTVSGGLDNAIKVKNCRKKDKEKNILKQVDGSKTTISFELYFADPNEEAYTTQIHRDLMG